MLGIVREVGEVQNLEYWIVRCPCFKKNETLNKDDVLLYIDQVKKNTDLIMMKMKNSL